MGTETEMETRRKGGLEVERAKRWPLPVDDD